MLGVNIHLKMVFTARCVYGYNADANVSKSHRVTTGGNNQSAWEYDVLPVAR